MSTTVMTHGDEKKAHIYSFIHFSVDVNSSFKQTFYRGKKNLCANFVPVVK